MTNAVFTASESSAYDDEIERWYHFPRTYYARAKQAEGDLIVYYEPRRTGRNSGAGRQAYFAVARLERIAPDAVVPGHFYAYLSNFLEFDRAVPFREEGGMYYESALQKEDGSTNKGAFGRSVRLIPREEFERILRVGMSPPLAAWEAADRLAEAAPEYVTRPIVEQIISRRFRDLASVAMCATPTTTLARSPAYASSMAAADLKYKLHTYALSSRTARTPFAMALP